MERLLQVSLDRVSVPGSPGTSAPGLRGTSFPSRCLQGESAPGPGKTGLPSNAPGLIGTPADIYELDEEDPKNWLNFHPAVERFPGPITFLPPQPIFPSWTGTSTISTNLTMLPFLTPYALDF